MATIEATAVEPAFCGLFPHPPIIVPEVGRDRLADCVFEIR